MVSYYLKANSYKRMRRLRRTHRLLTAMLVLLLLSLVGGGVYVWQQTTAKGGPAAVLSTSKTYYPGTPKKLYTNEKFSFESSKNWQYSRDDSDVTSKFVFYDTKDNIIRYELDVYVGKIPADLQVSYMMPVTVAAGVMSPQRMSQKCYDTFQKPPVLIEEFGNVKFNCEKVSSKEVIGAGVVGGSYAIPMYTPSGALKQVAFTFIDHSSTPFEDYFAEILKSFKLN